MGRARTKHRAQRPSADAARPAAPPSPSTLPAVPLWIALAVLTFLAYSNSFEAALTMDSPTIVERDTRLRAATSENLRLVWTKNYWWPSRPSNLFRPVTTLSFLFNYSLLGNGPRPGGYHVFNFLLHALNAALVYAVVRRVTGEAVVGFLAAGLFATHPIATEAVTNVAGRADLLATAAALGGLCLHIEATRRANPWPWRAGLAVVALVGVFAKESAVVLLAAILLYDVFGARVRPAGPIGAKAIARSWPSYALLAPVFLALYLVRRAALADMGYYRDHFLDNPLLGLTFLESRLTALRVMAGQLWLLVWPQTLASDYSYDQIPLFARAGGGQDALTIAAAVLVVGLFAAALAIWRRAPAVTFFALLYFATLLPTSNLVMRIGSIMAERFLYLPSAAFAALVALGVWTLAVRVAARRPGSLSPDRLAAAAVGLLVLAGAARTYARNRDWRTEETLFRAGRVASPRSFKTHKGVAHAILRENPTGARLDEAIAALEEGLRIVDGGGNRAALAPVDQPSDLMAQLGQACILKGDQLSQGLREPTAEARAAYQRAVSVLERAAETDRQVNARVRALKIDSGQPPGEIHDVGLRRVHITLGNARMRLRDPARALEAFAYLRRLDPEQVDGYTQSAWALATMGRADAAAVMLFEAYILDDRPEVVALLRDVFGDVHPGIDPLDAAGGLNVSHPAVRGYVTRACIDLVAEFASAKRTDGARDLRQICIGRFGTPPEALRAP